MADYQLIYNCPGCGKPSQAPEGAFTNRCEYCNLVVRIGAPGRVLKYFYESKVDIYGARMAADRYFKENGRPLTSNITKTTFYYLPFYRFRGMALDYLDSATEIIEAEDGLPLPIKTQSELKAKDFDVTIPAFDSTQFNFTSLGVRPLSVPLYGFSRDEIPEATVMVRSDITPQVAEDQAIALHQSNLALYHKTRPLFSAMIGEQVSMIYFPVWALTHEVGGDLSTVFIDALAKRGYAQIKGEFSYDDKKTGDQHSFYIKPLRHQCPNCGADLKEQHFALFYPCKNCGRSYILNGDGYTQVKCLTAGDPICTPFWRFPLEFKSRQLYKTVQDFSNLLTTEIALLRKEKKSNRFYLYSPAFKASSAGRLAEKALSLLRTQPHEKLTENLPSQGPVFCIEEAEAKQMAVFLWQIMASKNTRIQKGEFRLDEVKLPAGEIVWLPMQDYQLIGKAISYKEVNVVNR